MQICFLIMKNSKSKQNNEDIFFLISHFSWLLKTNRDWTIRNKQLQNNIAKKYRYSFLRRLHYV